MVKSEKSFRKSIFGGFNSRDVVNYLAQVSKERREETDALRAGADKLRRERDDLISERDTLLAGQGAPVVPPAAPAASAAPAAPSEDTTLLMAERDRLAERVDALRAELEAVHEASVLTGKSAEANDSEEMRLRYYEMRKERDEFEARFNGILAEREGERASAERFERERASFESDRASMLDTLTRREQEKAELANERASWCSERAEMLDERQKLLLERDSFATETARLKENVATLSDKNQKLAAEMQNTGVERARLAQEEREAAERAERARTQSESVRQETAKLIADTRLRFNEMMEKSRASALEAVLELDRMRGFLARFPDRFAETEQILTQMENDPRPFVREFVPPAFDEAAVQRQEPQPAFEPQPAPVEAVPEPVVTPPEVPVAVTEEYPPYVPPEQREAAPAPPEVPVYTAVAEEYPPYVPPEQREQKPPESGDDGSVNIYPNWA